MNTDPNKIKERQLLANKIKPITLLALGFLLTSFTLKAAPITSSDQPDGAGIWAMWDFETSLDPDDEIYDGDWLRGTMVSVDWKEIQPTRNGGFTWGPLNTKLDAALNTVEQVMLIVYHANASPVWIYKKESNNQYCSKSEVGNIDGCVPRVCYKGSNPNANLYPDYNDPEYETLLKTMIQAVANHIGANSQYNSLVTVLQAPIGKSGDPNPYDAKSKVTFTNGYTNFPIGKNSSAWETWEREISKYYLNQFVPLGIKVLYKPANISIFKTEAPFTNPSNDGMIMMKTTFVSHGYQSTNETTNLVGTARDRAKPFLIRGELAEPLNGIIGKGPEYNVNDDEYWNDRPRQNLYWQCLWMLHLGMDVFNIRDLENFEKNRGKNDNAWDEARDTFQFFSARAGIKNAIDDLDNYNLRQNEDEPWRSKYAFIALREGLAYESTKYVPGPVPGIGQSGSSTRFTDIKNAVNNLLGSDGHVEMNHQSKANKNSMPLAYLKDLEGINDINYEIYRGNYTMFITQIDPEGTSQGYWNMGKPESNASAQQYGRYAKGFPIGSANGAKMYFDIDKNFFSSTNNQNPGAGYQVQIDVIYLDKGNSKFKLKYDSDNGQVTAYTLTTGNTNTFKTKSITITDARFKNNLANGADIILEKTSGNPIFHMIEVVKVDDGTGGGGPPVLDPIADVTVDEGGSQTPSVTANAPGGNSGLTLSASGLPGWASFTDNGNGNGSFDFSPLYWVVAHPNANQTWNVTVTVDDGSGGNDSQTFVLTVNDTNRLPTLNAISDVTMDELTNTVVNLSASDNDGDSITLLTSGLPSFGTLIDNGDGTGTIDLSPSYQDAGSYTITVDANDGYGGTASQSFNLIVNNVNRDPSFTSTNDDVTVDEGATATISLSATDPDVGDTITYSVTGLPAFGTLLDNGDGTASITLTPGTDDSGIYNLTVVITDDFGGSASDPITITVNDVPPPGNDIQEFVSANVGINSGDTQDWKANGNASDGEFLIYKSNAVGDYIQFNNVNVPSSGDYDIYVRFQKIKTAGIIQLQVNAGRNAVGSPIDCYAASSSFEEILVESGRHFSSGGNKPFTFEVTGQNAAATGHHIRVDYIRIVPAQ